MSVVFGSALRGTQFALIIALQNHFKISLIGTTFSLLLERCSCQKKRLSLQIDANIFVLNMNLVEFEYMPYSKLDRYVCRKHFQRQSSSFQCSSNFHSITFKVICDWIGFSGVALA